MPLDARTLLATPVYTPQQDFVELDTGKFIHLGIVQQLKRFLSTNNVNVYEILLSFNIDGLPIFNNSAIQVWPIQIFILNLNLLQLEFFEGNQNLNLFKFSSKHLLMNLMTC